VNRRTLINWEAHFHGPRSQESPGMISFRPNQVCRAS
jgi:hypothetical protein